MLRSEKMWKEIERESGQILLRPSGFLVVGEKDCPELKRYESTAYGSYEVYSSSEMNSLWPRMKLPAGLKGIFDKKGGTMLSGKALEVYKQLGEDSGAKLHYNTKVDKIFDNGVMCDG